VTSSGGPARLASPLREPREEAAAEPAAPEPEPGASSRQAAAKVRQQRAQTFTENLKAKVDAKLRQSKAETVPD
jgi:hypothetical protein